jgi:hypothetical protein
VQGLRVCTIRFAALSVIAALFIFVLAGHAARAASVVSVANSSAVPPRPMWDLLRVRTIGYQLARANAARCETPTMQTGLILHDIGGFAAADRAAAMHGNDLTHGFGILDLVAASPAGRAGLRHGDEIVGINDRDLNDFALHLITRRASYDRVEAFEDLLQQMLREGDARLTVRRGSQLIAINLEAEPGAAAALPCSPRPRSMPGPTAST